MKNIEMGENLMTISVIVPVYNVEKYIDRCIRSVVNQTFSDIEIICICAKSSDASEDICNEWSVRDKRIRVLKQKSGRLGSARNQGILAANAELITFIDADDWWDSSILSKLYSRYQETNADMVMCNRYNVCFDEHDKFLVQYLCREISMSDIAESVERNPNLICNIEVSVNGKLYKKSLFIENNIWQPDVFGEDRAIMYYLITKCKRIGKVDEGLYFYHAERKGNSVCNFRTYETIAECMKFIYNMFATNGVVEKYYYQLCWIFKLIRDIGKENLSKVLTDKGNDERRIAEKAVEKLDSFMKLHYPEKCTKKYVFGSYNLRRITEYVYPQEKDKRIHYAYSSIISAMSNNNGFVSIHDKDDSNQMKWLCADCNKQFIKEFNPSDKDILFIDFLEERFPIAIIESDRFTYSPFFQDHVCGGYEIEIVDMEERMELWKQECIKFINFIKSKMLPEQVYLVKLKFTEKFGDITNKKEFVDVSQIKRINHILDDYYKFFEIHFEGIHIIENCDDIYFYTDENFKYGCCPWHVNELYYMRQGQKIVEEERC